MTEPSFRPVSAALDIDRLLAGTRDQDARRALHATTAHALQVLDRVHSDGVLPRIPIDLLPARDPGQGQYVHRRDRAIAIHLVLRPDEPQLTVLHEIGHFLDHIGVGGNLFAFSSNKDVRFDDWRGKVQSTRAARELRTTAGLTWAERSHRRYLLRPNELWARSYAQYIAVKSQDAALLDELDQLRLETPGEVYWPYQWDDDDFPPVFSAIDDMFRKLEWIR